MGERPTVLVLGGGPDAERSVSIDSAHNVAQALRAGSRYTVIERTIDKISLDALSELEGDVVFPVLHGPWGEGGPLQELLQADGRPFVGCDAAAARLAMDKEATKAVARALGVPTPDSVLFVGACDSCPLPLPVVVKPIAEGSTFGLHVCHTAREWRTAHAATVSRGVPAMVERYIAGRELTVGVVCGRALAIVEIEPASGLYDFAAKYELDDTRYTVAPELPEGVDAYLQEQSLVLCQRMGCAMVSRVDWILDEENKPMLLEINTMPGFTSHSLLPMAAGHEGMTMASLCERLIASAMECPVSVLATNKAVLS